jgi:hypothetical protein
MMLNNRVKGSSEKHTAITIIHMQAIVLGLTYAKDDVDHLQNLVLVALRPP